MLSHDPKYRHELKYAISAAQLPLLQLGVSPYVELDRYAEQNGYYNVRSLYFDDYYNRYFYESENGTDPREKFRIRIYNHSTDRISLECKQKERGKTLKASCPLTLQEANILMEGRFIHFSSDHPALLNKMNLEMRIHLLRPVVIVDYVRIPYVCKQGNVRITFDMNISSSNRIQDFFCPQLPKNPVMPVGQLLMEVKYDEYLPDVIYRSLNMDQAQPIAYSKYYLCIKYSRYILRSNNVIF